VTNPLAEQLVRHAGAAQIRLRPRRVRVIASASVDVDALEPALRALAGRGHRVQLAFATGKAPPPEAQRLAAELENLRTVPAYTRRDDWSPLAEGLRSPLAFTGLARRPILRTRPARTALRRAAVWAEAAIPTAGIIDEEINALGLDVVIATAGADAQIDWLLSARAAGMRTALLATGWNHLDDIRAKHLPVGRALVWNEAQGSTAIERLGLPEDRVVVVGASGYDTAFERAPRAEDRAAYLAALGLPADRPAILYAAFLADADARLIRRWIRAVRESEHADLREASVLVRRRPGVKPRKRDNLSDLPHVAVVDRRAIPHADCVVTVDPAVAIESAIAARPALTVPGFTVQAPLTREHGGPLLGSRTLAQHVEQLAEALRGPAPSTETFLHTYVRPGGLGRPAAPLVADAVEDLLAEPFPEPARPSPAQRAAQPLLWLAAASPRLPEVKGLRRSERADRLATKLAERAKARRKR
jgi:hypothetical protein